MIGAVERESESAEKAVDRNSLASVENSYSTVGNLSRMACLADRTASTEMPFD